MGILHCGNTAVLAKAVFEKWATRRCRLPNNTTMPAVLHAANTLGGVDAPPFLYGGRWVMRCLSILGKRWVEIFNVFLGKGAPSFVYFNLSLAG